MATNIMDLPEGILGDISVLVAKAFALDALSLGMVNKAFNAHFETEAVLGECSLEILPLYPFFQDPKNEERYKRFLKKLRWMENAEALYRKGVEHYFDARRRHGKRRKGVEELIRAANRGSRRAQYIVGIILVFVEGGVQSTDGYGFFARLMRPRLSHMLADARVMQKTLRERVIWRTGYFAKELLSEYVHDQCECEDAASVTTMFALLRLTYGLRDDRSLLEEFAGEEAPVCLKCFWHEEIVLLLSDDYRFGLF